MSSNVKSDGVVIIPTYNEKENIENIICKVLSLEHAFDILVIDDGSPDGTADIVKRLMTEFTGRLFIIERSGKQGLGTAYITGFKWALAHGYEYIFEMDADFSHNPDDLLKLWDACANKGADVAIGSRYTTAGFKCYRREVLETIDLDNIRFKGYAFQIEMKFTAYKCGFKLVEVPIIFINRVLGTSKMNSSIFGEAVFGVIKLKYDSWFKKYPHKKSNAAS